MRCRVRHGQPGSGESAQWLPGAGVRHPRGHPGAGGAQTANRLLLPGLAARAAQARRAGADQCGGDLLPARGVHPPHGPPGAVAGHHRAVQVPSLGDGQGPRRPGRGVPHPPAGRGRPVHVRCRRRAGAQGPRGRTSRAGARPGRHRRQRRRPPRSPGRAGHHQRGRRRLAGLLPRPDRPRPDRGAAGHLRRARRAGGRDRRDPARGRLAALPHPLRREPDVDHPEELVAVGQSPAAQRLRPARRRRRARPVRPRRRRPGRQATRRRRTPRDRASRHPGVHRVPQGDLATDLEQQPHIR